MVSARGRRKTQTSRALAAVAKESSRSTRAVRQESPVCIAQWFGFLAAISSGPDAIRNPKSRFGIPLTPFRGFMHSNHMTSGTIEAETPSTECLGPTRRR